VVVGFGVGGGEVVEKGVEDVVRGGVFGEVFAAERGGHGLKMKKEEFTAKEQRARRVAKFLWRRETRRRGEGSSRG
jgi:cell division GTPase FtsZ